MRKNRKIIILALLMAAVSLCGGHLTRQSRQRELLAVMPLEAVRAIPAEDLQFTLKETFFDGDGYVDCVLTSPERVPFYATANYVKAAETEIKQAVHTILATIRPVDQEWSTKQPTVVPGKSYPVLSFFSGLEITGEVTFTIDGNTLRRTVKADNGWWICTYTADRDALQVLSDGLYSLYLNRQTAKTD